jgi:hypothetical protein
MIGTDIWGSVAGTASQSKAIVLDQVRPDYPRNIRLVYSIASGSAGGGTATVVGKDQFGSAISETLSIAFATNAGTATGTKVFAYFSTATITFATAEDNGTVQITPDAIGTTCLFGLPSKISSTADVVLFNFGSAGIAKQVNGGTYGAMVSKAMHAIKAPNTITTSAGTHTAASWITVWYKPTYNAEYDAPAKMSNLT